MYQLQQVTMDSSWPGLDPPSGLEVDPAVLQGFAGMLRGELDGGEQVSPARLEQDVLLGQCAPFGSWPTGLRMEHGLKVAGGSIACYYEKVIEQSHLAADLLDHTAEEYRVRDESVAAGLAASWYRLAAMTAGVDVDDGDDGSVAGSFRESTRVDRIDFFEDVNQHDAAWIGREMSRLQENQTWRPVAELGYSLESVATRMDEVASLVRGRARSLAQQWSSETSVACQRALRRIVGTAEEVAECARRTSGFASESADLLQRAVHGQGFEDERSWWGRLQDRFRDGDPNLDAQFREELAALNESYRTVNLTLPSYVNADLPELPRARDRHIDDNADSGSYGSSSSGSGRGYTPPPVPSAPPVAQVPAGPVGEAGSIETVPGPRAGPGAGSSVLEPGQLGPGSGFAGGGVPADDARLPGDDGWAPGGGLAGAGGGTPAGAGPGGPAPGGVGPAGPAAGGAGSAGPGGPGGVGAPGAGAGVGPASGAAGGPGRSPGAPVRGSGSTGSAGGSGSPGGGTGARGGGSVGAGRGGMGMMPTSTGGGGGREGSGGRSGGGRSAPGSAGTGASGGRAGSPTGSGGAGRPGTGGVAPLAGRGQGGEDERQARADSWLVEDEDPWRGDDSGIPPPVIK